MSDVLMAVGAVVLTFAAIWGGKLDAKRRDGLRRFARDIDSASIYRASAARWQKYEFRGRWYAVGSIGEVVAYPPDGDHWPVSRRARQAVLQQHERAVSADKAAWAREIERQEAERARARAEEYREIARRGAAMDAENRRRHQEEESRLARERQVQQTEATRRAMVADPIAHFLQWLRRHP